jgi:hypothetical protein
VKWAGKNKQIQFPPLGFSGQFKAQSDDDTVFNPVQPMRVRFK